MAFVDSSVEPDADSRSDADAWVPAESSADAVLPSAEDVDDDDLDFDDVDFDDDVDDERRRGRRREVDDEDSPDDVDPPSDGSAYAMPGMDAIAAPTPKVTANAPTRPTYLA